MKRITIYFGLSLATLVALVGLDATNAQMMGDGAYGSMRSGWAYSQASSTMSASDTQAIAEGQALYQQLQAKRVSCSQLTNDNYEQLGEYFMGQMTGSSHATMDSAMSAMMGEQGDTAIHVAMGERFSGCVPNAPLPNGSWNGMMQQGGWSAPWNNNYGYMPMMGYGYGYGGGLDAFGFIWMILWWALIIVGIIVLVRWLGGGHRHGWHDHERSTLDILKERYAKGEIDRKEFEEKKKDLGY